MTGAVILVDDEEAMRVSTAQWLRLAGYEVESFASVGPALSRLSPNFAGAVITDVKMPGPDGMDLLSEAVALDRDLPVILVTGHGDVALAVEAMKKGAYDFIEKPFSPERLVEVLRRAIEKRALVLEVRRLKQEVSRQGSIESRFIGVSDGVVTLRRDIADLATTDASVLILGETGTGKELVARCLHDYGNRAAGQFAAINCGAIPDHLFESELFGHEAGAFTGALRRQIGTFEHADGGSLFLDEVPSLPLPMQVKILRALEEGEIVRLGSNEPRGVDVRLISAANLDIDQLVSEGTFRADLYYRLNTIEIRIPPLRERGEDVLLLFEHFVGQAETAHRREAPRLAGSDKDLLMVHGWPGNVRELINVANRFVLSRDTGSARLAVALAPAHPDPQRDSSTGLSDRVEAFEREVIAQALREHQGQMKEVMEQLGLARRTLNDKMAKYGLQRRDFT